MTTSLLNFVANGTVTTNAQANITSVGILTGLTVNGVSNLSNVGNVKITGGSNGQVIVTDGLGNLVFANSGLVGNGTVTQVDTSGNGLGFTLTGGPITTTGTVTLTVPNATSLRTSLNIGNVANLNLNGNSATFLAGDGSFIVPAGTYSNANVANYLPTYTGNLSAGNANISGLLTTSNANVTNTLIATTGNITTINSTNINATSNIVAPNIAANFFVANTANIILGLNGNIANFVTINTTTVNATTGNFSGNINSLNANLGNLAKANFFQGDGYLITNVSANFANFAGNVTNSAQPNITSVGTLTSLNVSGNITAPNITANTGKFTGNGSGLSQLTGANVTGEVAFANTANAVAGANVSGQVGNALVAGTVYTNAQPNITSVGTLTSLTVSGNINGATGNFTGNITSANANLGNAVTANYFIGNGSLLTGLVANNANFANYAGNVTVAGQSNITSLGTLTLLSVSGNTNLTGPNVSLGNVANLHITGGTNGYVLQTDGAGNISWVNGTTTGNGVVGGANRQIQYNNQGNFAGNVGFEYDYNTSNVNVPFYINSTQQNGNAYLTGWTNVQQMGIPSLFLGAAPFDPPVAPGTTYDLNNKTPITTVSNGNTATSVFGSNTFPKPGVPLFVQTVGGSVVLVPLIRNTGGNGNLLFSNSSSSNTIINFSNIGNGGIDAVVTENAGGNASSNKRFHVYSTDSTSSQIYLSTANTTYGNTNTTTFAYSGNYKVTAATQGSGFISNITPDLVLLNTNNFSSISQWATINWDNSTIIANGNIGTSNSYARLANIILSGISLVTYTANTGNTLGKYATAIGNANGYFTFTEYNLPTVTPNATNSFCFHMLNAGNTTSPYVIMSLKDEDVPNGISNTYVAISTSTSLNANSWTTYISANTPTWFDVARSNNSTNVHVAGRYIGIINPGNGSNSTFVTSTNNGQSWSSFANGNVALSYIRISNVVGTTTPPFTDTFNMSFSAIAPDSEFGIQSPSNVNANLFTTNSNIMFNYPNYISVGSNVYGSNVYLTTGTYKSLGSFNELALWVKES